MTISNYDDIIDSRDVIERLEELSDSDLTDEESNELTTLTDLNRQGEGFSGWNYGITLVNDSYFMEYIREMYEETFDWILRNLPGAIRHSIDWDSVAESAQSDYSPIDFDSVTYWTM